MRISSTLFFQTGLNSIHTQQSDLMHIYQQVASGQRMITPADDPRRPRRPSTSASRKASTRGSKPTAAC